MSFVYRLFLVALACGLLVAFVPGASAEVITHGSTSFTMDFVTVGDAGNTADTTGFGAVGCDYNIGKYEVTADQWAAVIAADSNVGNAGYWSGLQPTGGATWYEAAKFCNWLTSGSAANGVYSFTGDITNPTGVSINRPSAQSTYGTIYFLPTEDEWYKAAYYKGGGTNAGYWDYPTADSNLEGGSPPPDGIDTSDDTTFDFVFRDGYDQNAPKAATNAGDLSPYGTMGQAGNVSEWNETLVTSSLRVLRGGRFSTEVVNCLQASFRYSSVPENESNGVGFRVASNVSAVPEPGSLIIWACGGLGGVAAKKTSQRRGGRSITSRFPPQEPRAVAKHGPENRQVILWSILKRYSEPCNPCNRGLSRSNQEAIEAISIQLLPGEGHMLRSIRLSRSAMFDHPLYWPGWHLKIPARLNSPCPPLTGHPTRTSSATKVAISFYWPCTRSSFASVGSSRPRA